MRYLMWLMIWLFSGGVAAADPVHDLVGKTYQVETTPEGAVNVAIDFNHVGYGVVSPSRIIPGIAGGPMMRIETLADARGISVVMVSALRSHLTATVDEWLVTAAISAPKISSDSNMTYECAGNTESSALVQLVYYDGGPKGRPIRKPVDAFTLDRTTGQLAELQKMPQNCKATEDPL